MPTGRSRSLALALAGGMPLSLAPMSAQRPAGLQLPPDARRTFADPAGSVPDLARLAGATSEVRRSFAGSYPPLYQAAYMLGGLQTCALAGELVPSKLATVKAFNDAVLGEGQMTIEILRAVLAGRPLTRDHRAQWRSCGDVAAAR